MRSSDREWIEVGELGVDGGDIDESVDGDESADGSSELVSMLRLSFERAFRRTLPGKARLTRLASRADRLEVELPYTEVDSVSALVHQKRNLTTNCGIARRASPSLEDVRRRHVIVRAIASPRSGKDVWDWRWVARTGQRRRHVPFTVGLPERQVAEP